ncbi:MAG TPA: DegT/DnrJ/EryC1/StrS aminotransferase family protein [Nannocystaceae bacterium]|nr:DegT/DnrJ/EryC1/StrS aminotransferase family protein [Nannocystaceae bacterium]
MNSVLRSANAPLLPDLPAGATQPRPGWPVFEPDEIAAATDVLASGRVNYWTGEHGKAFEREFAAYHDTKHAIALANGTLALELALLALDIGPGDEVIVPSRTFIASASAVVARGARPVIADVDRDSGNLTAETVKAAITNRTRAVVAVHLGGWPVDIESLRRVCAVPKIAIVEDCAQSHGAKIRGRRIGSLGDIAAFSFCQDKIMTTAGEGGMVTTDVESLFQRMWAYKDHGKDLGEVMRTDHPPGFRWLHASFGSNYRLPEVQSAIGRAQLQKLDAWVMRRRRSAEILRDKLADLPALRVPWPDASIDHAFYRFYAYVRPECLKADWSRDRIAQTVSAEGIPCMQGSCSEIWRERAFPPAWRPEAPLPVAAELGRTSLAMLVHPTLGDDDMAHAAEVLAGVVRAATR